MKFVVASLLLGCSALICKFVTQLPPLEPPQIEHALQLLQFSWPKIPIVPPAIASTVPKIEMSKAETFAIIEAAAARHRVASAFVKSIVAAESNFDCNAVSSKGAVGLMQLMPDTARQFGVDPAVPEQNVEAGTHYLRKLMDRYRKCRHSLERVIAAYNAGPGRVDRYRGIPPYHETRQYVARVLGFLRQFELPGKHAAKG